METRRRLVFAQPEKTNPSFYESELWESDNYSWFPTIFGLEDGKKSTKEAGIMDIPEGRLVTFPNLLFYAHNDFQLVDKTRNGHLKMLTLLLVDPNIRLISSALVPCQQYDWWVKEVTMDGGPLQALPYDVRMEIVGYIQKWWSNGTGYPKDSRENVLIFKERQVHTKYREVSYPKFADGDSDSEN